MTDPSTSQRKAWLDAGVGIVFWFGLIGIGLYLYLKEHYADVFLDASLQPVRISGTVLFEGVPVDGGTVHVVVSDAKNKHYLSGTTLDVNQKGRFTTQGSEIVVEDRCRPMRVDAEFRGTFREPAQADSKDVKDPEASGPMSGEATLYFNRLSPVGERFLWGAAAGLALLLVLQLILFTGGMRQSKARSLFVLMYFFTFISLALPIGISLVVAQNPYVVDAMEASPIGLVRARTKDLSAPQWLVNIGGTVVENAPSKNETASSSTTPKPVSPTPASVDATAQEPEAEDPVTSEPGKCVMAEPGLGQPKTVIGGVAVPFYVVLLAMFGAGINMTLKVPEIQRKSDLQVLPQGRLGRFFQESEPASAAQRRTAADIRRELIENFMYLLSAPFLAIAMYYLLQLLADQVTEPVLVIMAFATGLVSKAVVGGIIKFAETRLHGDKPAPERGSMQADAEATAAPTKAEAADEAKARQLEAEAAAKATEEAQAVHAKAEAAAKVAEEADAKQADIEAAAKAAAKAAKAKQVETEATAKRAQPDQAATAEAEAAAAAKAAKEAKARHDEAEAAAKTASEEAKARRAEAERAAKAARNARAKQAETEAAAQAAAAKLRLAEAEQAHRAAAKAVEAAETAAAKATEEAKTQLAEAEAAPESAEAGKAR